MNDVTPSRTEILEGVRECLVESLAVEPDEVQEEALLVQDLGLASIDMLDLLFGLNTTFELYIRPQDVQTQLLGGMTEEEFLNPDRTVSERGYERIAELVPSFKRDELEEDLTDADLFPFFKVQHIVDLVNEKLTERDTAS